MAADSEKGKYESPKGSKVWEYIATFSCSILMFCIGSSIGWNSPSSVKLESEDSPIRLNSADVSTLCSLIAVGQMIAPPLNSILVDRIGRKNTTLIVGLPLIISWSLISVADNVMVLYLARSAAGLSQGIGYCVCYMYVGEIASSSSRGVANVLMLVMLNLGTLMAFAVVPPLTINANAWLNLVLVCVFMGVFWFMPESPYFLMMRSERVEAEEVLRKLRGTMDVSEELDMIERSLRSVRKLQESHEIERRQSVAAEKMSMLKNGAPPDDAVVDTNNNEDAPGLLQQIGWPWGLDVLFGNKASLKAILIIGLFSFSHHFGGYTTVLTYGQRIFKDLKVQLVSDYAANVINGVVQLVSVALTTLFVDRWGRKPLIILSGFFSGLCCLFVGIYFYALEYYLPSVSATAAVESMYFDQNHHYYSLLPMVAVFLIVFFFNCGLIIVQGILISELFAPEVKAIGVCMVIMNGGLMNTVGTKLYMTIVATWNYGHSPPFFFFVFVVWLITAILMYITPETKGKTLLEIQKALAE